jgi:hypothetical protein
MMHSLRKRGRGGEWEKAKVELVVVVEEKAQDTELRRQG